MTDPDPDLLREAGERCRRAAAALAEDDGTRATLHEHADRFETLAARDRTADHGRIDRHMYALGRIAEEVDDAARGEVTTARDLLEEYRLDVEGV